jgi:hypothetical protein
MSPINAGALSITTWNHLLPGGHEAPVPVIQMQRKVSSSVDEQG